MLPDAMSKLKAGFVFAPAVNGIPFLLVCAITFAASTVLADTDTDADKKMKTNTVSITVSPLHAGFSFAEGTVEFRVARKLSVSAIVGGSKKDSVFKVGAQVTRYFTHFDDGFHVGAEVQYGAPFKSSNSVTDEEQFGALGALLGWKWVHGSGLTLVAQGGIQYRYGRVSVSNSTGTALKETKQIGLLVNLNAGWSF